MKHLLVVIGLLIALCGSALAAVNVNTATKEELDSLKGIGPVKAQAIIDYRAKNGPFRSVDDLEKVPGIGPKTLSDIRRDVTVTGASSAVKPRAAETTKGSAQSGATSGSGRIEPRATERAKPSAPASQSAEASKAGAAGSAKQSVPAKAEGEGKAKSAKSSKGESKTDVTAQDDKDKKARKAKSEKKDNSEKKDKSAKKDRDETKSKKDDDSRTR